MTEKKEGQRGETRKGRPLFTIKLDLLWEGTSETYRLQVSRPDLESTLNKIFLVFSPPKAETECRG